MMSLFSSFDYCFFSLSILVYILFIYFILFFSNKISFMIFFKKLLNLKIMTFLNSIKNFNSKFVYLICTNLFLIVFLMNYLSVLPYNFSFTSQVSVVLFLSLSFWLTFLIMSLLKNFKGFISHCIPEGAPFYLSWFLFLIELVSISIRPLTLMVRLSANILAGHLLMILLSKLVMSYFFFSSFYLILNMLEMIVSLIQSYIMMVMIYLYYSEL